MRYFDKIKTISLKFYYFWNQKLFRDKSDDWMFSVAFIRINRFSTITKQIVDNIITTSSISKCHCNRKYEP